MKPKVLYSFPHRIGAGRICDIALHQISEVAASGAEVTVFATAASRRLPSNVELHTTLSAGKARVPERLLGRRAKCRWHDHLAARWIRAHRGFYDVFHGWPLGSLESLHAARAAGAFCLLERPNAHTAFAYAITGRENQRLGVRLPKHHDHSFDAENLAREEQEYAAADALLCPSDFVRNTFLAEGFDPSSLLRHQYGYDPDRFRPRPGPRNGCGKGLVAVFAGVGEPRKGLHIALEAWKQSGAGTDGRLMICGRMEDSYLPAIQDLLDQNGVEVLGPRPDVPELMAMSDVLLLPSLEEGSALVTYEARGAGCVPLVSDHTGAPCTHMLDGLIHPAGNVAALTDHLRLLDGSRDVLAGLRARSLAGADSLTWRQAGQRLLEIYRNPSAAALR